MRRLLLSSILMLTVIISPSGSSGADGEPPIHECDRLAASPRDPHRVGEGVKWGGLDAPRAIAACKKAVQLFSDVPRFQYQYGRALNKGKQYQEAFKWNRLSAEQGYDMAQYVLGAMYFGGQGVPKDQAKAAKWLRFAAKKGLAFAQTSMGKIYKYGNGVPQDYAEAANWYRLAAKQGNAFAKKSLGVMYGKGQGVPQDFAEAIKWFRLAAEQGSVRAKKAFRALAPLLAQQGMKKPSVIADYQKGWDAYLRWYEFTTENYVAAIKKWKPLAEQGDALAQYNLGVVYEKGLGVSKDHKEAEKWLLLSAKQGNADAQFALGKRYQFGSNRNELEREKWWRLAAEQGHPEAQYRVSRAYKYGTDYPKDKKEGMKWLRLAAENGSIDAQIDMGGGSKDEAEKLKWYRLAAEQLSGNGLSHLASMYSYELRAPRETPQDLVEAVRLQRLAAKSNPRSKSYKPVLKSLEYRLARQIRKKLSSSIPHTVTNSPIKPAFTSSFGVGWQKGWDAYQTKDFATAYKEWKPLAEQGNVIAQNDLGVLYGYGLGVSKNFAEEVKWYRRAAEQGFTKSQINLGNMYKGQGVGMDNVEVVKWYRLAAKQGDADAQNDLGLWYLTGGRGVSKDATEAAKWLRLAADQGVAQAQRRLGLLYAEGKGAPKDFITAYMWFNLSVAYGHKTGYIDRDSISKRMAPAQIAEAQRRTAEWKPTPSRKVRVAKSKSSTAPKSAPTPKPSPPTKTGSSGSGFFVSKLGHVITNEHVVRDCGSVTVGDNAKKQVTVTIVEKDKRNDLALLKISSTKMASVETKSLISKLGITVVPLASDGLLRSEDVELGEDVLVSGYPYGDIFSNTIKVTKGIVSANRGFGDDTGQFQMDAAVQPGNSGGPIYDENGNIVGVVVSQLNKMKFAKATGSMPENVNFGIKASTVRQFLTSSGLPTKWSKKSKRMTTKDLAKIAKNQTVMVVCNP